MIVFGKDVVSNLRISLKKEWLLTNGIGGYASSTVIGCNTRCGHGLLVVPVDCPDKRAVLLSKFEEVLQIGNNAYHISTNRYPKTIHPHGYLLIQEFSLSPFPRMLFMIEDIVLEKEIIMLNGMNAVIITYRIYNSERDVSLIISPLVAFRYADTLLKAKEDYDLCTVRTDRYVSFNPVPELPLLFLYYPQNINYVTAECWYRNFEYDADRNRGKNFSEDLYNTGYFMAVLKDKAEFSIIASAEKLPAGFDADKMKKNELERLSSVTGVSASGAEEMDKSEKMLRIAADSFVIEGRGNAGAEKKIRKRIVSGYHWGKESLKDSMISLQGLLVCTGRKHECEEQFAETAVILKNTLLSEKKDTEFLYSLSADLSAFLWMINSSYHYYKVFNDGNFIKNFLFGICELIIDAFIKGIGTGIKTDDTGLLVSYGKRDEMFLTQTSKTPMATRYGKLIEIQALWYNALRIMERYSDDFGFNSEKYRSVAEKISENLLKEFWIEEKGYLRYFVSDLELDDSFASNQILAAGLPFALLPLDKAKQVVAMVHRNLFSPMGLKLCGAIGRNFSYSEHYPRTDSQAIWNEAVFPCYIGVFIDAYFYVNDNSEEAVLKAGKIIEPLLLHLNDAGLGYVSEYFDSDKTNSPGGCIAHAVSVAELLRIKLKIDKLLRNA